MEISCADWIAIGISALALVVAGVSAWYAGSQARTAEATRRLEHEALFRLRWHRPTREEVLFKTPEMVGDGDEPNPQLRLENVGKGIARSLTVRWGYPDEAVGEEDNAPGSSVDLRGDVLRLDDPVKLKWKTPDGKRRKAKLKIPDKPDWWL